MICKGLLVCLLVVCVGCGSDGFSPNVIEATPLKIDAEYVMLTQTQVQCGVQEDLWEAPVQQGERSTARLKQKAHDLKFAEDVSIGDLNRPYAQIRGEFSLRNLDAINIKDGPDKDTKLVESKVAVIIDHTCFPGPLPMMGVRHGHFEQEKAPILQYRLNNGWQMERFVH